MSSKESPGGERPSGCSYERRPDDRAAFWPPYDRSLYPGFVRRYSSPKACCSERSMAAMFCEIATAKSCCPWRYAARDLVIVAIKHVAKEGDLGPVGRHGLESGFKKGPVVLVVDHADLVTTAGIDGIAQKLRLM